MIGYTFAAPRCTGHIRASLGSANKQLFRIANLDDLVPTELVPAVVPAFHAPYKPWIFQHIGTSVLYRANWLSWKNNHTMANYRAALDEPSKLLIGHTDTKYQ